MYCDVGVLLDVKLKDTSHYDLHKDSYMFCTAVTHYIQNIHGISHDDYDYSEVNAILPRDLKAYIKTTCCYPERLKSIPDLPQLSHSQKV